MNISLPNTEDRVYENTDPNVNENIQRKIVKNVDCYIGKSKEEIDERIQELNKEWDIERVLESNASTMILGGTILGATVNRKWFVLPMVVSGFLLQHAVQGWCPPLPILRRMGVRTVSEIEEEKAALRAIRKNYDAIANNPS